MGVIRYEGPPAELLLELFAVRPFLVFFPILRPLSLALSAVMAREEGGVRESPALDPLVRHDHDARHSSGHTYVSQHTRTRRASRLGNAR